MLKFHKYKKPVSRELVYRAILAGDRLEISRDNCGWHLSIQKNCSGCLIRHFIFRNYRYKSKLLADINKTLKEFGYNPICDYKGVC